LLERQTGLVRSAITHPEQTRIGSPVELRFTLGAQSYAVEHTQIEAFADQILTGEEFHQFVRPVVDELSGVLPGPAVYHLYFPANARLGLPSGRLEQVRRDFITWVREHAQRLHDSNPERPTRERNPHGFLGRHRAVPPGFPYEVVLQRVAHWSHSMRHYGVLLVARIAPENVEELRAARLRQALDHKCPKLQRCKADGVRTVLVLEDADSSLSNHVLIGDGLAALLGERNDLPDEIYLVETAIEPWDVRRMKYDGDLLPDDKPTEFASADLVDVTGGRRG
jgi:hypothetical protein